MAPETNPEHPASESLLHILTLTPFFPSRENDVNGCFIKEPLDSLTQLGVVSSVIAASPIHHPRRYSIPAAPATWVRYPQFPGIRGLPTAGRFLYARLLPVAARLHRERPITLIHAHGALPCGRAAALLAQALRIPLVVSVHGLDVFNDTFLSGAGALSLRQASIAVYEAAQCVICVSARVHQILRDGMPTGAKSAVVYNGADTGLFSPSKTVASTPNELLVVGNLIPSKCQDLVLRAVQRMAAECPQLQCRVIGEGPDRARLEALARELGIRQSIHFLGRQSRAAVADAMRRCSVFVLPSRSEGLGCVYLEAMACAKPVIACRGQGIGEIIVHGINGWLIPPDDLGELVRGLSSLLLDADTSSRMGSAARETVLNRLTLSDQARQLESLYRQALAGAIQRPTTRENASGRSAAGPAVSPEPEEREL